MADAETKSAAPDAGALTPQAIRRRLRLAYAPPVLAWPWPDSQALNDALADAILAAEKKTPTFENNLVGGWSSRKDLLSWKVEGMAELSRRIQELAGAATRATNAANVGMSVRFRLEAWANVLRAGGYHNVHDHPNAVWSGVYYVRAQPPDKARPLAGVIEFVDPRQGADANSLPGSVLRDRLRYAPAPGLMIVFPGWLRHLVHPVAGDGERISISFNVYGAEIGPGDRTKALSVPRAG
jgi:uncharacterized protein (TIGR02466 family)